LKPQKVKDVEEGIVDVDGDWRVDSYQGLDIVMDDVTADGGLHN